MEASVPTIIPEFKTYNRYQEVEKRQREMKEQAWEKELISAMNASNPLNQGPKPVQISNSSQMQHQKYNSVRSKGKRVLSPLDELSDGSTRHGRQFRLSDGSSCDKVPAKNVSGDVQVKLQSLDFIDRTPSPVERLDGT